MKLNFNSKVFLSEKLNDGFSYSGDDCGCIKGNFALACGLSRASGMEIQPGILKKYPKLQTALDTCEYILLKGFPQKAKLLFDYLNTKYDLIPEFLDIELSNDIVGLKARDGGLIGCEAIIHTPIVTKVATLINKEVFTNV